MAGALLGLAVTVEYQSVLAVVVLAGWLVASRRGGDLVRAALAAVPFGGALVAYHWVVFGGPLESGYSAKAAPGRTQLTTHVEMPTPAQAAEVLVGSQGLLLLSPIVVLALAGLVRRTRQERDPAGAIGLAVTGLYVLMHASWASQGGGVWAGETPGPRFLTVALPFAVVGLADAWERTSPVLRRALAAVSVANMLLVTGVYHLIPRGRVLWDVMLGRVREGAFVPTTFTFALGPWGTVVQGLLVAAALGWVVHLDRARPDRVPDVAPTAPSAAVREPAVPVA